MANFEIKDGVAIIPEGTEEINSRFFQDVEGLTTVVIPKSVVCIDKQSFLSQSGVTKIIVEEGNERYDSRNNCNAIIETKCNTLVAGCASTVIPDTVEEIGSFAFRGCKNLTNIEIPSSVTKIKARAFMDCEGLTSIVIPDSVERLGYDAFKGCKDLKSIVIPSTTYIEKNHPFSTGAGDFPRMAFKKDDDDNIALTNITITKGNGEFERYEVCDECNAIIEKETSSLLLGCASTVIPDGVKEIWDHAFAGCLELKSIYIPATVTSICKCAFLRCTNLASVHISDIAAWCKITFESYLGDVSNPLYYAHHLYKDGNEITNLEIPEGTTVINDFAFMGCSGLTSVTIPKGVISIGASAFSSCAGLASIIVESGNTVYDSRDNSNAIIETSTNTLILGCKNTVIPNSVTSIGDLAFYGCSDLTSITIPNSVTSIGDRAFDGCSDLTSITIPDSVTTIGWNTFANCNGLTTVTLPKAVKEIGGWAFRNCTGITTINVPAKRTDYYKKRLPKELHQFIVEMEPVKKAKKK